MNDIGEPCDTCARGIAKFVCFDAVRRCQKCITQLVSENRWDALVLPLVKAKKRKRGEQTEGQATMF